MNFLTKRQQQVLRRLLHGAAEWDGVWAQWALPLPPTLGGKAVIWYSPVVGDSWTSTTTLHLLADAELVGDFLDGDGALCYALTAKGRLLAGLLGGGDARVEEVGK